MSGYRCGFIAVVGRPNVGKSSLMNALAGHSAAIVAETAGTTRDVVEVQMELGDDPVNLADTAGLRDADRDGRVSLDKVELEGMRRARARASARRLKRRTSSGSFAMRSSSIRIPWR